MSGTGRRGDGAAHEAVRATLGEVLDEIRWRHPAARVSCVAWVGPFLTMLGCSTPASMRVLRFEHVYEGANRPWAHLLEDGTDDVFVPDVRVDPRFDQLSTLTLGADTVATRLLGLRAEGELVGFLRMDATDPAQLDSRAALSLAGARPYGLVAVALEREYAYAASRTLALEEVTAELHKLKERQRQAGRTLRRTMGAMGRSKAGLVTQVGPDIQAAIDRATHRCAHGLRAALDVLGTDG